MGLAEFERELRSWAQGLDSVLELGAGNCHWRGLMPEVRYSGMDLNPSNGAVHGDIRDPSTWPREAFEGVLLVDAIEHLTKSEGLYLLRAMERQFSTIGIFTPIGFMPQDWGQDNPNTHRSGWMPEEFRARGFCVVEWPDYHVRDGATYGAQWAWRPHK